MSRQYHYLIAGFPDLLIDDTKVTIPGTAFRESLEEGLHPDDWKLIRLFFLQNDNKNLLLRLQSDENHLPFAGNYSAADWDAIVRAVKDDSLQTEFPQLPPYFGVFIHSYLNETPLDEGKAWDIQLSELFYNYVGSVTNVFISGWFSFERDLNNILTAAQCRKYNLEVEKQLIGKTELTEKLSRSSARDFGITPDFPHLSALLKAIETEDLLDYERKIDRIKWDFLDEEVFFHYFSIEKIFSLVVKLSIIERWLTLDVQTGKQLFTELLQNMEASYEFPEEFKLKK